MPMADLQIEGYAARFHALDDGRDIILPGAFARALKRQPPPLLLEHDPGRLVGRVECLDEDPQGLFVRARVETKAQAGAQAAGLICLDRLAGLSIGFRARRAERHPVRRIRRLYDVDLIEISLVAWPMQRLARLTRVRALTPPGLDARASMSLAA